MRRLLIILSIFLFYACNKKEHLDITKDGSAVPGTPFELVLDSVYLYAEQVYLWNDALPSYTDFNPRVKYAEIKNEFNALRTQLFDITQFKIDPSTGIPYETGEYAGQPKYSFLQKKTVKSSSSIQSKSVRNAATVSRSAIFDAGNSKVGYLYLPSFPALGEVKSDLDAAFEYLAKESPSTLVVDLRNNGGGYVETAEYIANLIVPSALTNKLMYSEHYNTLMQQGRATILNHQPLLDGSQKPIIIDNRVFTMADIDYSENANKFQFSKKGALETIENVYFIVSQTTASASEMLINVLDPYLKLKLVGSKTYGKPIGFVSVTIDKYTVYFSGFVIKNARGFSDYFGGMKVDIDVQQDGNYEIGNPKETCLKRVLDDIQSQSDGREGKAINAQSKSFHSKFKSSIYEGLPLLIENRYKIKQP